VDGTIMPTFPSRRPTKPKLHGGLAAGRAEPASAKPRNTLTGRKVLVVEDEAMIAGLIEMTLGEAGCSIVGPVATLEQAFETLERERLDAALLDIRLNGRDVYAVADALNTRGIPFIFISGFTQKQMPPGYRKCPYIAKPFVPDAMLALLAKVVGERRS
jgi:CheY-like chemotaxis protein